jgi:DNA invertase Pin-like site-specific DNA recombinase
MSNLIYARVSTADQSTDSQLDRLRAIEHDREFVDSGVSGRLASRPALNEMLAYARSGDVIIVTKLDRLGRSVKNLCEIADLLAEREVGLRVLDQGLDTTSAAGRLLFHVLASIGEFESSLARSRTLEGLASARARGRVGGRPPRMTQIQIRQARSMYDSGEFTVEQIAETFSVSRLTIYRALAKDRVAVA